VEPLRERQTQKVFAKQKKKWGPPDNRPMKDPGPPQHFKKPDQKLGKGQGVKGPQGTYDAPAGRLTVPRTRANKIPANPPNRKKVIQGGKKKDVDVPDQKRVGFAKFPFVRESYLIPKKIFCVEEQKKAGGPPVKNHQGGGCCFAREYGTAKATPAQLQEGPTRPRFIRVNGGTWGCEG